VDRVRFSIASEARLTRDAKAPLIGQTSVGRLFGVCSRSCAREPPTQRRSACETGRDCRDRHRRYIERSLFLGRPVRRLASTFILNDSCSVAQSDLRERDTTAVTPWSPGAALWRIRARARARSEGERARARERDRDNRS